MLNRTTKSCWWVKCCCCCCCPPYVVANALMMRPRPCLQAVGADRIPVTCKPVRPSGWQQQQPRFARIPRRPSWARAAAEPATATADSSVADSAVSTYLSGSTSASSTAGQGPEWQACVQRLQCMGFSDQDAERFVQRAFGWGPKAKSYWRHEKVSSTRHWCLMLQYCSAGNTPGASRDMEAEPWRAIT